MRSFAMFVFCFGAFLGSQVLPARADDKADATATVFAFVRAFNAGDAKGIANLGAPANQAIIDDFAPHYWNGPNALANWYTAFKAQTQRDGLTGIHATIRSSDFTLVAGNRAYAPLPMEYTFKVKGAASHERGFLTVALEKVASGWRILGWSWARVK